MNSVRTRIAALAISHELKHCPIWSNYSGSRKALTMPPVDAKYMLTLYQIPAIYCRLYVKRTH